MATAYLTKSRYLAGLQCGRRLWRLVNDPQPYEVPAPGASFDVGAQVGQRARLLFPGGVAVTAEPWQHTQAVAQTMALMDDPQVPAIFEAAFEHDNIRVRVDILCRNVDGSWGLTEVKSSTGLKDHYIDDIALQVFVLRGRGIILSSIELLYVNNAYVRGPKGIEWEQYFARLDIADEVNDRLRGLSANLAAMWENLNSPGLPFATPGKQCSTPHGCEFWDACTNDKPADWVANLPRLSTKQASELESRAIESIAKIPADFRLTSRQGIIRDVLATGRPFVAPDLSRLLHRFGPPALYLDFEAMMPAIPLYEGTRPYQPLPFQWSLHQMAADGAISHEEYLADGNDDPRREFATTLIATLRDSDLPIIVYSPYEQTTLKALERHFSDLAPRLNTIINRLADLLPIIRSAIYHADFQFSNSIKKVGPALCPDFGYDDLEDIADGQAAAAAFTEIAGGFVTDTAAISKTRNNLLAYCKRDTLAMVEVHKALVMLSALGIPKVTPKRN